MEIDNILEKTIASFDISPTDFQIARDRYASVAKWLDEGKYKSGNRTDIYLQGSFRLGTVIRPYRNSKDADYDIDQVCEIIGSDSFAHQLKHDVGDRLKDYDDYDCKLDDEGRRCWTLIYASTEGRFGFHLDVLPSRPKNNTSTLIEITHKDNNNYLWLSSNPKGYYKWFKSKNKFSEQLMKDQKSSIYSANKSLFRSVEEVPKMLIRTTLQRSIQLMKRNRDVYFDKKEHCPISIILTTICTHKYQGQGIIDSILSFGDYVAKRLTIVVRGDPLEIDNVLDFQNNKWIIKNPADDNENFADKWEKKSELANSFFAWVYHLRRSIISFKESTQIRDLNIAVPNQEVGESYGQMLLRNLSSGYVGSEDPLLNLIHKGIEKKVEWNKVQEIAFRNTNQEADSADRKDIAFVNYYQVKIHSGSGLSDQEKVHIRSILSNHNSDSCFILCCNLLLGTATAPMLQACLRSMKYSDILSWPIIRLAKKQITGNLNFMIPYL